MNQGEMHSRVVLIPNRHILSGPLFVDNKLSFTAMIIIILRFYKETNIDPERSCHPTTFHSPSIRLSHRTLS